MGVITSIIDWIKKLFRVIPKGTQANQEDKQRQELNYNNTSDYLNITAIIAQKIANVTLGDSSIDVMGDNERAVYLAGLIKTFTRDVNGLRKATTNKLGTGGVVWKPYIYKGKVKVEIIPQSRFVIIETVGDTIIRAAFVAEIIKKEYDVFIRMEYHSLAENGVYTIEQRATMNDREIPLTSVAKWANMQPIQIIQGIERMLFVYDKCPIEPRGANPDTPYGVPITNGCDKLINQVLDTLDEMRLEIKNKRAFVGVSDKLIARGKDGKEAILPKDGIYKTLRQDGDEPFFQIYSPDIRIQSYIDAINFDMALIEKAIATNKGTLTELESYNATATEIKRSQRDTFSLTDTVWNTIEDGTEHLAYIFDVMVNLNKLAPTGSYEMKYDKSYGLVEDSSETFDQLLQGQAAGAINPWELRQFITDEDEKQAKENLPEMISLMEE